MARLSEESVVWWERNIRRAFEREDALGGPWSDAPTADDLQHAYTYLIEFLAADERDDASWGQIVGLLPVFAHVTLKWTNPDSDVIGSEMCRPLEDQAASHTIALVSRFNGGSDAWFRRDWSVGQTILEETKASVTIGGTVNKLREKLAEVETELINHPVTKLPNVLTEAHKGQTVDVASFSVLLQRWLKLYFACSLIRRGETFERYLQRTKQGEPSQPNNAHERTLPPQPLPQEVTSRQVTAKQKGNVGLWTGLVISSILALSALGRPNFGLVSLNGLPNGTTSSASESLGYDLATVLLSYVPFIYFSIRYIIRWRRGR